MVIEDYYGVIFMKILVVCQHFYPENFRINDICYELVKRGHEVTVLTGLPNYPRGKVLKNYRWHRKRKQIIKGVKIKRCSLIGRGKSTFTMIINYMSFALFASIKAIFMRKDFDLVYVYQLSPITMTWPAIVVQKMKKIPLIIHVLDQWPISITTGGISKKSVSYRILTRWSKQAYNSADLITCSSKSFKKYFVNELGISKNKKFIYLPSYAESDYLDVGNVNNKTFDLLFAGNVGPAQSVETIIEAAKILKQYKRIKFHIVGDGLSLPKCQKMVEDYNLDNIIFYGYHAVSEMPQYYKLADAFLITMVDNEVVNSTLPAKVQSYMMAAKPIIGAIGGEVSEVIKSANCGLCCKALDYQKLADLILAASRSKKLAEWGKNAYHYYLKNFEKKRCLDDLEKVFTSVISKDKMSYK